MVSLIACVSPPLFPSALTLENIRRISPTPSSSFSHVYPLAVFYYAYSRVVDIFYLYIGRRQTRNKQRTVVMSYDIGMVDYDRNYTVYDI